MEREQDFDNEIEIDLKDLFLEIISYWQWIKEFPALSFLE